MIRIANDYTILTCSKVFQNYIDSKNSHHISWLYIQHLKGCYSQSLTKYQPLPTGIYALYL